MSEKDDRLETAERMNVDNRFVALCQVLQQEKRTNIDEMKKLMTAYNNCEMDIQKKEGVINEWAQRFDVKC